MNISRSINGNTAIINLAGQFTFFDDRKFLDMAREVLHQNPYTLAINVSNLPHMNSTLIANFLTIFQLASVNETEFLIYGMNQNVLSILEKVFLNGTVPLLTEDEFSKKYL